MSSTQLMAPFDARNFDPSQSAGSLPIGKHPVIIYEASIETNKQGNGGFLQLMLKITDGPNAGQTGPYRLNLYNQSAQAVDIAHRQLSAICYVTGVFQVTDAKQLFNIPFIVEVGMQKGEEAAAKGYTEIKRVFDRNGVEPKGQQPAGGQAQPQGFGGQPQGQQQPAQGNGAAWGGQPQGQSQTAAPAAQQPAAWGNPTQGQPQQPAQQPQGQNPAWGAQPAQGQPAGGGGAGGGQWQQQQQPQGAAPWGR